MHLFEQQNVLLQRDTYDPHGLDELRWLSFSPTGCAHPASTNGSKQHCCSELILRLISVLKVKDPKC